MEQVAPAYGEAAGDGKNGLGKVCELSVSTAPATSPAAASAATGVSAPTTTSPTTAAASSPFAAFLRDPNAYENQEDDDANKEKARAIALCGCELGGAACEGDAKPAADGQRRDMALANDEMGGRVDPAEIASCEADFGGWPDRLRGLFAENFAIRVQCPRVPVGIFRLFVPPTLCGAVVQLETERVPTEILPVIARVAEMQVPCLIHCVRRSHGMTRRRA